MTVGYALDDNPLEDNPFAPVRAARPTVGTNAPRKLVLLGRGLAIFGSYAKVLLVDDVSTAYAQFGPLSAYPRAQRLRDLYPAGRFEVRRFRPNLVVSADGSERGFVENAWVGKTLRVGDEVRLKVTGACPRRVMTTLAQADLPRDTGILRTAARHNNVSVGVYASVVRGGVCRRGDVVSLEP